MQKKYKIKTGDTVRVTTGNSKGQEGKIISIDRKNDRVLVEGVNLVSKHTKPNASNPQGGIVKKEASLHISNVVLLVNGNPTKVGRRAGENGKLERFAKSLENQEVIK